VSQTTSAEYHGFCFWVFDVSASILFAEMAAVASQTPAAGCSAWLADLEHQLRVHAIVSDFAIPLDEWYDGHEEQFLALVTEAGRRLAERGAITAQQAGAWVVLDGTPIIWRGQDAVDTDPIVTFAEALAAIIGGTYPQAPPGRWWCFGLPGGVQTISIGRTGGEARNM
jgi:hypothetical protein